MKINWVQCCSMVGCSLRFLTTRGRTIQCTGGNCERLHSDFIVQMLSHVCRYMSMAVVHNGTECVLLALGCSDGAVRSLG